MNFKQSIQAEKENIIKSICQLVSIPSTEGRPACGMPFGEGPAKALQYVLDLGRNMGFHVENFDNLCYENLERFTDPSGQKSPADRRNE